MLSRGCAWYESLPRTGTCPPLGRGGWSLWVDMPPRLTANEWLSKRNYGADTKIKMVVDSGQGKPRDAGVFDIPIPPGTLIHVEGRGAVHEPCKDPDVLGFRVFPSSHLSHLNKFDCFPLNSPLLV